MCLLKKYYLPFIALKPIKCYKIFDRHDWFNQLETPIMRHFCDIGDTIKAAKHWMNKRTICKSSLEGEVVHAYKNFYEAKRQCYWRVVCECIIPPFTAYWLGINNDIGATRIKINKIIYPDPDVIFT